MAMIDTHVKVASLELKNPILPASGCFGMGDELLKHYSLENLGGLVSKAISLEARLGNPTPRIAEAASGMLNAVGLENPGLDYFIEHYIPLYKSFKLPIIVNVVGHCPDDYVAVCQRLEEETIDALEINLSCPNVKTGCMSIGSDPKQVFDTVSQIRKVSSKDLWIKLSPNVSDISEIARAAEAAGADVISAINTLVGIAVDVERRRPILANVTGGLSGPCIKPVALRLVREIRRAVKLPIVGMGGISDADDVLAFMMLGASAVEVGTLALIDPDAFFALPAKLEARARELGYRSIEEVRDSLIQ
ncbi:MAG: dihydroorotate dehydrogenase [Eubacteriales bacterium]|nr:dihydroorotate dehydrogenase [Eubacteriales bacterium]